MSQVIGLLGAKGAGKSEVAKYLVEQHGFVRLRFADGVKEMLKTLGLTDAQVDGDEKELPIPLLGGKRYRDAATSLGTGWGRDMMDPDLWVRALEQRMLTQMLGKTDSEIKIVIDDVRYPNECALVERYGGTLATVRRPSAEPYWSPLRRFLIQKGWYRLAGVHSSEVLYRLADTPFKVWNNGGMEDLHRSAESLLTFVPDKQLELT